MFYPANATPVRVLLDTSSCVVVCRSLFGDRYLGAGASDRFESWRDGRFVAQTEILALW